MLSVPRATGILLLAAVLGCSGRGGARPTGADLAQLVNEAAALDPSGTVPVEPSARGAVREALRKMLELDHAFSEACWKRVQRAELQAYLFRHESYIGGEFPRGTAELLREVQELEDGYLEELQRFPELLAQKLEQSEVPPADRQALVDEMAAAVAARWKPVVAAVEAHRAFADAAAELYELVASEPESIRALPAGLEFSDETLEAHFDEQAKLVNDAQEAAQRAYRVLDKQRGGSLHWLGHTKRVVR